MNPFLVVFAIALLVALVAFGLARGRSKKDYIYFLAIAFASGCLYLFLPWIRGGEVRGIYSIDNMIRISIIMGGFTFIGLLFKRPNW